MQTNETSEMNETEQAEVVEEGEEAEEETRLSEEELETMLPMELQNALLDAKLYWDIYELSDGIGIEFMHSVSDTLDEMPVGFEVVIPRDAEDVVAALEEELTRLFVAVGSMAMKSVQDTNAESKEIKLNGIMRFVASVGLAKDIVREYMKQDKN